jgi:DNA repair protein RecN (Recombination protein N)
MTGETGAGKSIIMGALSLILGERAESSSLLNKEKKCVVEGYFESASNKAGFSVFLKANNLDVEDELTVRREISAKWKIKGIY